MTDAPAEPARAMLDALNEWRPDYPWPPGDPTVVVAVVLAGLEEAGYSVVLTADIIGVTDAVERMGAKLASTINLSLGVPTNSYIEKGYGHPDRAARIGAES